MDLWTQVMLFRALFAGRVSMPLSTMRRQALPGDLALGDHAPRRPPAPLRVYMPSVFSLTMTTSRSTSPMEGWSLLTGRMLA